MRIEFWGPLVRAWRRMTDLLFRPFDPVKWLILALCAWLAGLLDGQAGGPGEMTDHGDGGGVSPGSLDWETIQEAIATAWEGLGGAARWILGHWGATVGVVVLVPIILGVVLGLVWVSSRFKLIFLDNLVRRTAEIRSPWRRLGPLADSLFLFRLGFGCGALSIGAALTLLLVVCFAWEGGPARVVTIVVGVMLLAAFVLVVAYAALFLESFVVPIMYRRNLLVLAAWGVFAPVFSAAGGSFLLYGLFVLALFLVAALALGVFGLATCCLGFLLLAIPYVGTVLLLPLLVAYRYLSLEFLAQFGPDLDAFAGARTEP